MKYLIFILFVSSLFYGIIPAFGAFATRSKWRKFRKRIIDSCLLPIINYKRFQQIDSERPERFRFYGSIEAVEDEDILWVKSDALSTTVNLKKEKIYFLSSFSHSGLIGKYEDNIDFLPDDSPRHISWSKLNTLPLGLRIMVDGPFEKKGNYGVFSGTKDSPLTVVIYDGEDHTLLRRIIWGGRQKNEYWNWLTPGSLVIGALILLFFAYGMIFDPGMRFFSAISFIAAGVPILPFLPPGVIFVYFYILFWKQGRYFRAERDLLKLPLRYFQRPDQSYTQVGKGIHYLQRKVHSLEMAEEILPYGTIRKAEILKGSIDGSISVFGISKDDQTYLSKEEMKQIEDPFIHPLIVLGDPMVLSEECSRRARLMEWMSVICIGFGLAVNSFLLLLLILRLS